MATLKYDLVLNQGEDVQIIFPVFDPNGDPLTVDGWTAKAQIRRFPNSSPVFYEWSAAHNNITVAGTSVTLKLAAADSDDWTWSQGVYDLELTDPLGKVTRIAQGTARLSNEVTR